MLEKIKANFNYVLCAAMGLLSFILMAMPFVSIKVKTSYGSESETWSGYEIMELDLMEGSESDFMMGIAGFMQIMFLIVSVALLIFGALALLKAFGLFEQFPDQIGKFESKKIAEVALRLHDALGVVVCLLTVIWGASNSESKESAYYSYALICTAGVGSWITMLLTTAAAACPMVLPRFVSGLNEGGAAAGPQVTFHCAQCGKKAGKNERFCNACGGTVVSEVVKQYNYVCGGCGKKMKQTDRFCNACGGTVTAVEVKHYEYVCGGCGKKMKKTDRFCNVCGGAMVQREIVPTAPAAPVAPVAPAAPVAGPVCPTCGKALAEGQRFCNGCGTKMF